MKPLRKKIQSRRGETLVETLVALVVVVLASTLLLTMITAAGRLNASAIQKDRALFAESDTARRRLPPGVSEELSLQITKVPLKPDGTPDTPGNPQTIVYPVSRYGGGEALRSYRLGPEVTP